MGKSQELYKEAKNIIPGGTQLLSKRSEMFLPEGWPAYYKKAKGVEIWDLDDNHYYDMSIMGVGTCILGYANDEINKAVIDAITNGNMSTLNCYEEVQLAQKLIELHPWAQMVRYSKTGGEACAIAVRIARAFSKKDKVAFCGYHGWSDWYLASNLSDNENLNGQLLPGLEPLGIPQGLKNTSFPFHYGADEELEEIIDKNKGEIGVIITEIARHEEVDIEFLNKVREIARDINAVLIFDEVSSGFRTNLGGMHLQYNIEPDILILGKALGNGYPISAVIGKKEVMDMAQETFISSTYWTERIGFVAALETIKIFERENIGDYLIEIGAILKRGLVEIFQKYSLKIEMVGLPSVLVMMIREDDDLIIKTIFTQEMLKKGFLASSVIYVSAAHTMDIVQDYLKAADETFANISEAIKGKFLGRILNGPVCHSSFMRLN